MTVEKLNIYQRINAVREQNEYLKKDKSVDGQYKVVTHDQVTHELRADLVKFGIVVEPFLVSERTVQDTLMFMGVKKNPLIRMEGVYDVFFVNVDDPKDRACVRVAAHALDSGDKAPGKMLSYAVKAAMLKVFSIETGEDDEARKEKDATGSGLTVADYEDWTAKIDKLSGNNVTEIDSAAQMLWELIHDSVNVTLKDETSGTKLRARLTAKVSALRKALPKK